MHSGDLVYEVSDSFMDGTAMRAYIIVIDNYGMFHH